VSGGSYRDVLVAYDLATGTITPLTPPLDNVQAASFTWTSDTKRRLAAQSDQICASFGEVDESGFRPLTVVIGAGRRSWSWADEFHRSNPIDELCTGYVEGSTPCLPLAKK
jgi:hypothetical protein